MRKVILAGVWSLGILACSGAAAEVTNLRNSCDPWEYVPASETLQTAPAALLFCNREDGTKWLALRVDCRVDPVRMQVRYTPAHGYAPPPPPEPDPEPQVSAEEADLKEAARLLAEVPYDDSGIKIVSDAALAAGHEMVFLDFQSFGYTAIAKYLGPGGAWEFDEPNPLSPIFSRMITGNYADFKLLPTNVTERFPLRGSGKALRPVVESCRQAKRAQDRANK